jgi:protein-histidine pros-kinase
MGLRTKFNLVFILAFGIGMGLAAFLLYQTVQKNARDEVRQNAEIMMESALATRDYTVRHIRPLLELQMKRQFLPHSIPSYAAQQNFAALTAKYPEFTYKEAALNPTNPKDRATDWEADIINEFRNNPERQEIIVERQTALGPALSFAHPIQIKNEGCLECHSTPANAPATMRALYGDANGFGWQLNEVIGAQVVTVPMSLPLQRARETFITFMAIQGAVFLVILIILNILLHVVVIKPVVRISDMASRVSLGEEEVPEYVKPGKDEIASLSASFNRMRRSLENAMKMLGE